MDKFAFLFVAALLTTVPSASGFAQDQTTNTGMNVVDNENMFRGQIVSIDSVRNKVVVKELSSDEESTLTATPDQIGKLTVGERVLVKFDPATNVAESIRSTVFKKGRWWINDKE